MRAPLCQSNLTVVAVLIRICTAWRRYLNTDEAKACAAWQPDLVILGPFGKHDALGQYPPPKGGARYDEPPTFSEEEFYAELKGMAEWARGRQMILFPVAYDCVAPAHHRLSIPNAMCVVC